MWLSFSLLFVAFSTLSSVVFAFLFKGLNPLVSLLSIFVGLVLAYRLKFEVAAKGPLIPRSWDKRIVYSVILFLGLIQCYGFLVLKNSSWSTLDMCNFGDLPFHISLIRYFSAGAEFWPNNPVFWEASLRYPIGMDLFSALFDSLKVPLNINLMLTGAFLLVVLLRSLDIWGGLFVVMAFFFSGGVEKLKDFVFPIDMFVTDSYAWKNLVLTVWVTQRGFQFALPAGVIVIIKVFQWMQRDLEKDPVPLRELVTVGLLGGSIALFNLHSFGILSLFLTGYALIKGKLKYILPSIYSATVVAGVIVCLIFSQKDAPKGSLISWYLNWTKPEDQFFLWYWLKNFLAFIPIALYFVVRRTLQKKFEWLWLFVLAVLMTSLILAVWRWDQVKVILWIYLLFAGLIAQELLSQAKWKAWLAGFLCFVPGFFQLLYSTPLTRDALGLFNEPELKLVQESVLKTDVTSRFFILPSHNHPVFYFGRRAVLGHAGHVWSHGYNFVPTDKIVDQFMHGAEDWKELAEKVGATHVFWGYGEKAKYGDNTKIWMLHSKMIADHGGIQIFEISK